MLMTSVQYNTLLHIPLLKMGFPPTPPETLLSLRSRESLTATVSEVGPGKRQPAIVRTVIYICKRHFLCRDLFALNKRDHSGSSLFLTERSSVSLPDEPLLYTAKNCQKLYVFVQLLQKYVRVKFKIICLYSIHVSDMCISNIEMLCKNPD